MLVCSIFYVALYIKLKSELHFFFECVCFFPLRRLVRLNFMSYNLRSNKSQMEARLKMIVVLTACWLLMAVRWTMLCRRNYRSPSWNSHAAVAQSYAADPPPCRRAKWYGSSETSWRSWPWL